MMKHKTLISALPFNTCQNHYIAQRWWCWLVCPVTGFTPRAGGFEEFTPPNTSPPCLPRAKPHRTARSRVCVHISAKQNASRCRYGICAHKGRYDLYGKCSKRFVPGPGKSCCPGRARCNRSAARAPHCITPKGGRKVIG